MLCAYRIFHYLYCLKLQSLYKNFCISSSSSSSFSALRLLCHSGKVYLHKFNVGMVTQVRLLHLVVRVVFFYDLELDLSVNLSVPSM